MTEYSIESATIDHVFDLGKRMRKLDKEEVWAASHSLPVAAVLLSIKYSSKPMTGLADGRVVCMFGVGAATVLSLTGVPWLLATDELEKHARAFLRRNKQGLLEMSEGYTLLRNYVDVRNRAAIRWLGWLGFTILPPEPYGMEGLPFHPFEMKLGFHVKPSVEV